MPDLVRYEKCPICGCPDWWVLATELELAEERKHQQDLFRRLVPSNAPESVWHDLTVFTNSYDARLVVCRLCGLVSRDPHFSPQGSIEAFARDNYSGEWMESTLKEYEEAFSKRVERLVPELGARARVLEIGSYVGGFLAAAERKGWLATGVDVGRRVTEFSRDKGLDVRTGTLAQARFPDGAFDAVFVWVCFDQLPSPRSDLTEIRRVLRKGGYLFIQVPNGDFMNLMERCVHAFPRGGIHERVLNVLALTGLAGFPYQIGYTPKTITRLLQQSGFGSIRLANRSGLTDNAECNAPPYVAERRKTGRRVVFASHILRTISLGRWVKAPWMEISCLKTLS